MQETAFVVELKDGQSYCSCRLVLEVKLKKSRLFQTCESVEIMCAEDVQDRVRMQIVKNVMQQIHELFVSLCEITLA